MYKITKNMLYQMYGVSYTFSKESSNVVTWNTGYKETFCNCIYAIPYHSIKYIVNNWHPKFVCGCSNEVQKLTIKYKDHREKICHLYGFLYAFSNGFSKVAIYNNGYREIICHLHKMTKNYILYTIPYHNIPHMSYNISYHTQYNKPYFTIFITY